MKNLRAFTLIEMLVVISIIALLIALLMPTLGGAIESARQAECMSSQKQLAIAYTAYSNDNVYQLMVGVPSTHPEAFVKRGGDERAITDGVLYDYVSVIEFYQCPEDPNGNLRSYSIPGVLHGENWNSPNQQGTEIYSDIIHPSEQILWFEESDHRGYNVGSWILRAGMNETYRWVDYVGLFHHNETTDNVGFLDGHVESKTWEDPETIKAGKDRRFYLNDPGNVDWDWIRPRYRQLQDSGNVKYIPAS